MKAMIFEHPAPIQSSPLKFVDLPDPEPAYGQIRIRVDCCAICRTDLHIIEGDLPYPPTTGLSNAGSVGRGAIEGEAPHAPGLRIPGHQIVGRVDQLGEGALRLTIGERVGVAWLGETCGTCSFCLSGRENLCERQRFTGYHVPGGYAELAVANEAFVYRIPESFESTRAAPLLCAGIIGYRALARCDLPPGGSLGLYGFGSSAHIVMPIAKHRGSPVYVITRGAEHRRLAREMGAVWTGGSAEDLPVNVDCAILFAPAGELVPPALSRLSRGGTLSLAGICVSDIPSLNYESCLFYEKTLRSVTANTREDGRALLKEAADIPIRPHVRSYPLHEANRALEDLKSGRINGTGVLVMGR